MVCLVGGLGPRRPMNNSLECTCPVVKWSQVRTHAGRSSTACCRARLRGRENVGTQSMSHQVRGFGIVDARNAALGGVTTSPWRCSRGLRA